MSKMKTENIKALNEIGFTTPDLEAAVIYWSAMTRLPNDNGPAIATAIFDRLRAYDELKIRFKYLEKKHEDLYERLIAFAEKLGESLG